MKEISLKKLEKATFDFLKNFFEEEAAAKSTEVLLWAETHAKDGQGLLKLMGTEPLQSVVPAAPLNIIDKTPVSALIEGNRQPSFYIAQTATDIAIQKASQNGISVVGANGIFSSTGVLGFYADKIARQDLIGIVMARSPGAMAPFGTTTPFFGTNPMAFGFPTLDDPIVFDMATSAITWYELVMAKMRGQEIPQGVAINDKGHLTTDPAMAMNGAILPFDKGYKGSGLSMVVELMSGPLVNASFCDCQTFDKDWGLFVLCLKPDLLADTGEFQKGASDMANLIRSAGNARMPGDGGRNHAKKAMDSGVVFIDDAVADLLGL